MCTYIYRDLYISMHICIYIYIYIYVCVHTSCIYLYNAIYGQNQPVQSHHQGTAPRHPLAVVDGVPRDGFGGKCPWLLLSHMTFEAEAFRCG